MPITPFHFGPGAAIHALAPKQVSFLAFCVSNILIDIEPLYFMLTDQYPLHRFFSHTDRCNAHRHNDCCAFHRYACLCTAFLVAQFIPMARTGYFCNHHWRYFRQLLTHSLRQFYALRHCSLRTIQRHQPLA